MTVTWNESQHGVGISDIDDQHQQLFVLTNQVLELPGEVASPDRTKKLIGVLKQLYAYTRYHFSTEESIFAHYGYPGAPEHLKYHAAFTTRIQTALVASREPSFSLGPLADDLVDWILNHITKEDRKFAGYFKAQGVLVDVHFSQGTTGGANSPVRLEARNLWFEKKLALDISTIDRQHQELVLILQQANDLLKASDERRQAFLPTVVQKLQHYAEFHFLFEEELMSRYGYHGVPDHQKLHLGYVQRIRDFSQELLSGHSGVNEEIVLFLKQWIVDHILVEDRAFKTQCQEALSQGPN